MVRTLLAPLGRWQARLVRGRGPDPTVAGPIRGRSFDTSHHGNGREQGRRRREHGSGTRPPAARDLPLMPPTNGTDVVGRLPAVHAPDPCVAEARIGPPRARFGLEPSVRVTRGIGGNRATPRFGTSHPGNRREPGQRRGRPARRAPHGPVRPDHDSRRRGLVVATPGRYSGQFGRGWAAVRRGGRHREVGDAQAGRSSIDSRCRGRSSEKWRRSSVASFGSPSRSTTANTAASTKPMSESA